MSLRPWTWSPLRTLSHTLLGHRARRRKARPSSSGHYGRRFAGELLEPRQLLTTLQGGDVFEFLQRTSNGEESFMRISLEGNIQAEVLGSFVSKRDNRARIVNMPGVINRPGLPPDIISGGIGGPGGIDIIGPTGSQATGNPDINALAADSTGTMYAFDVETIPVEDPPEGQPDFITRIFLMQINTPWAPPDAPYGPGPGSIVNSTATVVAELTGALAAAPTFGGVVTTVAAADFHPISGLLYFVTRSGEDGIDQMFTIDVNAGSIPGSLQAIPGIFQDSGEDGNVVSSIAFDQTGPGSAQLLAAIGDDQGDTGGGGGGGGGQDQQPAIEANPARIVIVDQTNTNFLTPVFFDDPTTDEPEDLTIGGIEVLNEDPTAVDSLLLIGGGSAYELVRNDPDPGIQDGLLINLGGLSEPPPPPGAPELPEGWVPNAEGATALTFHPTVIDPFTLSPGAYIGYDADTDNLFFVNRNEHGAAGGGGGGGGGGTNVRTPFTLYQIYVASSDATGRIAIARVPPLNASPRNMIPFQGNSGPVRHINAQDPGADPILSESGTSSGPLFLGAQTLNLNPDDPFDDLRPLLDALLPENINTGLYSPTGLPIDPDTNLPLVPAGLTIIGDMDRVLLDGTVTGSVTAVRAQGDDPIGTGSINQFYAGWLLTGNANGEAQGVGPTRPQNFLVQGDLRELYVLDSVGTQTTAGTADEPTYVTGFDLSVGGTLGNVRVGDSWVGNFRVANRPEDDPTRGLDVPQTEMEWKTGDNSAGAAWDDFLFSGPAVVGQGSIFGDRLFYNDTFQTFEYKGAIDTGGQTNVVQVDGTVQHIAPGNINDWVDYYGVALMAGQTVQVQLASAAIGLAYVGVFDPDQRLIATDASDVSTASAYGVPFQFTADRPGIYRFAVSLSLNFGFYNSQQTPTNIAVPYQLSVTGVGDLGVGGIQAGNDMLDVGPQITIGSSYTVESGDLGGLYTGDDLVSIAIGAATSSTVRVQLGNLRVLDADEIGFGEPGTPADPADPTDTGTPSTWDAPVQVDVPAGSVGLVQARGDTLAFNFNGDLSGLSRPAIGGDYQVVSAAGSAYVELIADRGIGVLRAAAMDTLTPSTITANFDNTGNDGIIDLIDVTGQFGTFLSGGPGITTNSGGNVRYMRVGGNAYNDAEFGGGGILPIGTTYEEGETAVIKDDSGATLNLIPSPRRTYTVISADGTEGERLDFADSLLVRAYPIRGSGGNAILDVRAGDAFTLEGTGNFEDATGEIGRIIMESSPVSVAQGVVLDLTPGGPVQPSVANFNTGFEPINPGFGGGLGEPDARRAPSPLVIQPLPGQRGGGVPLTPGDLIGTRIFRDDYSVLINGSSTVDVWDVVVEDLNGVPGDGKLVSLRNETRGGELVNVRAASIVDIVSRGTIGMARSRVVPALALNPLAYYDDFVTDPDEQNFPGRSGTGDGAAAPGYGQYYAAERGQFPTVDVRTGVWITGDLDDNPGGGDPEEVFGSGLATDEAEARFGTGDYAQPGNVRSIRADQGVGNVIVNGSIGELNPNADGTRVPGEFAGINGIVWARGHSEGSFYGTPGRTGRPAYDDPFADRGGDIWYLDIGEGVAAGGSGSAIRAGIYAARHIDHIFGENADIRGNIIAGDEFENPRNRIDTGFRPSTDPRVVRFVPNALDFDDSIRLIELRNGSIINANIGVVGEELSGLEQILRVPLPEEQDRVSDPEYELGRVVVSGNGGIIGTSFQGADIGLVDVNRGFGIFSSEFRLATQGVLGGVEADNYGVRNTLANVGERMNFLVAHGDGSSVSTDAFSASVRRSEQTFPFGVDPLTGLAPNPATDIHAYLGTSATVKEIPGRTDTGILENIDFRGTDQLNNVRAHQIRSTSPDLLPSVLNFGNTVGALHVRDQINGLKMTTGRFGVFRPQGDVYNLDLTVAGQIKDILIHGDLGEGSVIRTAGRVGNMGNIRILGSLNGDILASGRIKRLFVAESISGNVESNGGRGLAVGQLIIGGDIADGGLAIRGNMGRVVIGGDFGRTGTLFSVAGKLGSLTVKGNLFSNIQVGTVLGRLNVFGSIMSGVTIEAQRIGSVRVGGDVEPGVIFRANRPPKIRTGGQMLGTYEPLA